MASTTWPPWRSAELGDHGLGVGGHVGEAAGRSSPQPPRSSVITSLRARSDAAEVGRHHRAPGLGRAHRHPGRAGHRQPEARQPRRIEVVVGEPQLVPGVGRRAGRVAGTATVDGVVADRTVVDRAGVNRAVADRAAVDRAGTDRAGTGRLVRLHPDHQDQAGRTLGQGGGHPVDLAAPQVGLAHGHHDRGPGELGHVEGALAGGDGSRIDHGAVGVGDHGFLPSRATVGPRSKGSRGPPPGQVPPGNVAACESEERCWSWRSWWRGCWAPAGATRGPPDRAPPPPRPPRPVDLADADFDDLTAEAAPEVDAVDNLFKPPYITVKAGTTVTFRNDGRNSHNVYPATEGAFEPLDTESFEPGTESTITFDEAGDYAYYCTLHGTTTKGMVGAIRVVE
jgi:plastocyanin